jgi:hypothetical protein
MTLLTAKEIEVNYPQNTLIEGIQDKETGKWTSVMYRLKNDMIHKTLLSFNINENFEGFDTMEDAIEKMEEIAKNVVEHVQGLYKGDE